MARTTEIKTTGQLREVLARQLARVEAGNADLDATHAAINAVRAINDSIFAEVKAKAILKQLGETAVAMGQMKIG